MWVMNTDGFFSIVKDRQHGPGWLLVRARCIKDIERLMARLGAEWDVLELPEADYRYRIRMHRDAWSDYLQRAALAINYTNFKNSVPSRDHTRHAAYMACWSALRRWQDC